jgi:Arc/MetJ-type ribon-helix-helix transcriptional regulator
MPSKYSIMPVKKFGLSVDEKTYQAAKEVVESGAYRNMSHLFEEGAKRIIQEELTKKSQVNPYEALASL